MRHIGIFDSSNEPIFEGDTLEITKLEDISFSEDFIESLKIDRLTIDVAALDNEVGVELHYYFWSKGEVVLNSHYADYLRGNEVTEGAISEHFSGKSMEEPICTVIQSWHDSSAFHHAFVHRSSKTIISKSNENDRNQSSVSPNDLKITIGGVGYKASETKFLIELTPNALIRAKEAHASLYGHFDENDKLTFNSDGDFTHILVKPKTVSLYEYELDCEPVNEKCEHTWYEIEHCMKKYRELSAPIKDRWKEKIELWEADNQHLSEDEIANHKRAMWKEAKAEFSPLEKSPLTEVKTLCTDLFMGLNSSKNLFVFFENENCKITPIVS